MSGLAETWNLVRFSPALIHPPVGVGWVGMWVVGGYSGWWVGIADENVSGGGGSKH